MMNERINLKEIERKAYTSYHQDGIIDILIALFILSSAVWIIADMIWLGWMFFIVATSIYAAAKKAITVPRIGFVKFPQQRSKTIIWGAVGLAVLLNVLGLITFMQVEGGSKPTWLLFAIEHYMIVIGVVVAALFCFVGYTFRTNRIYAYALLTLVIFIAGYFIYYPLHYYLILLGTLILLAGLVMLVRFVRRYPPSATGSMGDSGNEGQ
jgi:hypothetical protein